MTARPVRAPATIDRASDATPPGQMPDLRGLGAREALRALTRIGLTARINGDGFVIEQSPEAGAPVVHGDASVLTLGRRSAMTGGGAQQ